MVRYDRRVPSRLLEWHINTGKVTDIVLPERVQKDRHCGDVSIPRKASGSGDLADIECGRCMSPSKTGPNRREIPNQLRAHIGCLLVVDRLRVRFRKGVARNQEKSITQLNRRFSICIRCWRDAVEDLKAAGPACWMPTIQRSTVFHRVRDKPVSP